MGISSFEINIDTKEVDRLRRKLEDTRIPKDPIVPDAGGDYGWSSSKQPSPCLYLIHLKVHP